MRHKYNGSIRIVNETTYALNLGAWGDYDVISARHGDATDKVISFERNQEIIEIERANNPKSPAFNDAKNAFEQRAVTVNTNAKPEDEAATAYTKAVELPAVSAEQVPQEREVPTIGGKQTVKINKKSPGRPRTNNQDEVL
jgi:hypothetical protein